MNNNKSEQIPSTFEIQLARLVYIGSTISTLGGGLQTLAAGLALNALEKSSSKSSQNLNEQSKQSEDMEMQIDYIIKELKQIKKMMK